LTTDHKLQWFGTTRPRLGFLATPNLLLYGTAGVAYGQTKDNYTVNTVGVGTAATASINDVRAGWTAGGGIEGAFGGGWSAKVEYLYIDLGKLEQTVTVPPAALTATFNSRLTDNIVRVGLNYKWGGYLSQISVSEPRAACSRKRPSSLGTTDERSLRGRKVSPPPELAAVPRYVYEMNLISALVDCPNATAA